jgi:AcrR family transcriptional regulator
MTEQPPPLNKRQRAKRATRAKVLEAATALFAEDGYEAATIRAIAKRAGMSTGAFFASFDSKAEAYEEITGHPPVSAEAGAHLLHVVRGFALNGHELKVEEPWVGALERLLVLARGRLAEVWPEGLRSDVNDEFRVTPEEALLALEAQLDKSPPRPAETVTARPRITPGGLLQMARMLEEGEPVLARQLRERASLRAMEAAERLKARGVLS